MKSVIILDTATQKSAYKNMFLKAQIMTTYLGFLFRAKWTCFVLNWCFCSVPFLTIFCSSFIEIEIHIRPGFIGTKCNLIYNIC